MPVPSTIADLSTTAASNSPAGADAIGTSLDDYLRTIQAIIKRENSKGSDVASSTTIDVPSDGSYFVVTGNTTIAGIADDWVGRRVILKFSGTPQLTHSASFILPGSSNITAAAGDCLVAVNESTGVWRVTAYQKADGNSIVTGATQASIQTQSYTRFTAGGTADAITGTLSPAIASYVAGLRVTATPGGANTVTGPTLNLNSLGVKTIKKRDSSGTKVALVAGDYNASGPCDFEYDGTDFVLLNPYTRMVGDSGSGGRAGLVPAPASGDSGKYLKGDGTWGTVSASGITLGTAVSSTSGTSIDFTGLPAGIKRLTIIFDGVSTTGSSAPLVQLGDGSINTSGYVSYSNRTGNSTSSTGSTSTAGFVIDASGAASVFYGSMVIDRIDTNQFVAALSCGLNAGANFALQGGGSKTLSGTLDRVRITTVGGSDTFDAGKINISYE